MCSLKKYLTVKEAIDDLPKLKSGEFSNIDNHVAMNHTKQMLKKIHTMEILEVLMEDKVSLHINS